MEHIAEVGGSCGSIHRIMVPCKDSGTGNMARSFVAWLAAVLSRLPQLGPATSQPILTWRCRRSMMNFS